MKNLMSWLLVTLMVTTSAMFPVLVSGQSTTNYSVCQGVTESYWIQNPGTGSTFVWTITPGVSGTNWTITANNNDNIQVLWIIPGVYNVQVLETTAASCPGDPIQLTVTVIPSPTIANAGPDNQVCGLTYNLAGNNPVIGTGSWTKVSGPGTATFTNPNVYNTSVTVSVQGVYVFKWAISNGSCTPSEDPVQITFYSAPTAASAGPDQTLCGTLAVTLAGNTPTIGTGTWSTVSGPGTVTFTNAADPLTTASATVYGAYVLRWTTTNGTCPVSTDDNTVTLNQKPVTNGIWHN